MLHFSPEQEQIVNNLHLVEMLSAEIQSVDKLAESVESDELDKTLTEDVLQLIEYFNAICLNVEEQLENYMLRCKETNTPIDVRFFRILKEIKRNRNV